MSSFPQHEENLQDLQRMGFDVSEYIGDPFESWHYDALVYLVSDLISQGIKPSVSDSTE